jgi:hypothetical protein
MADIHKSNFTNINGDNLIVIPPYSQANAGNVLQINQDGTGLSWVSLTPAPPAPSYNYVLLQNFLDGHTIGTPISEADYSDFNNTYPSDKSAIGYGWSDSWSDTNLVSTTAGTQLLYSEARFDFSKYGLTTGQLPFGYTNVNGSWYMGAGYRDITLPTEFTYEVWFNSPANDWEGTFIAFFKENWDALKIVLSDAQMSIMFDDTIFEVDRYKPSGSSDYAYEPDQETFEKAFPIIAGSWYHFALSCDGTNLYVFINGNLLGTIVIANVNGLAEFLATAMKEIDVVVDDFDRGQSCVYLAQLALCDSCKWTADFTVPTVAY